MEHSTRWSYFIAAICGLVQFAPTASAEGRKLAVVVGVNAYRSNSGLPALQHAASDAAALSAALRGQGFTVYEMTHAVAKQDGRETLAPNLDYIRDEITGILGFPNLGAEDAVLISLHGHGVQFEQVDDAGAKSPKFYFCPADATITGVKTANELTERNGLLPLDELYADLAQCTAATKLLIVDACRNDPTQPGIFREGLASATLPKLPPPPGGTAAFFSCKAHERAVEDPALQQGVFTHFLVQGLQGAADQPLANKPPDGVITFAELSAYVANNTYAHVYDKYKVRQSPELRGDYDLNVPLASLMTNAAQLNWVRSALSRSAKFFIGRAIDEPGGIESLENICRESLRFLDVEGVRRMYTSAAVAFRDVPNQEHERRPERMLALATAIAWSGDIQGAWRMFDSAPPSSSVVAGYFRSQARLSIAVALGHRGAGAEARTIFEEETARAGVSNFHEMARSLELGDWDFSRALVQREKSLYVCRMLAQKAAACAPEEVHGPLLDDLFRLSKESMGSGSALHDMPYIAEVLRNAGRIGQANELLDAALTAIPNADWSNISLKPQEVRFAVHVARRQFEAAEQLRAEIEYSENALMGSRALAGERTDAGHWDMGFWCFHAAAYIEAQRKAENGLAAEQEFSEFLLRPRSDEDVYTFGGHDLPIALLAAQLVRLGRFREADQLLEQGDPLRRGYRHTRAAEETLSLLGYAHAQ